MHPSDHSPRVFDPGSGPDYCAILGVPPDASDDDIKAAYLQVSQTWRQRKAAAATPAAQFEAAEAERLTREARDVLLDPVHRSRFDAVRASCPEGVGLPGMGKESAPEEAKKRCPYCGEWILAIAIKCRYCGEFLERPPERSESGPPAGACTQTVELPPPSGPRPGDVRTFAGMAFCYIPSGTFWMGSPAGEAGRNGDEVRHQVTLTRGVWLKQTPVTHAEWERVMGKGATAGFKGDDCPVEQVSWFDAVDFSNVLSRLEGTPEAYIGGAPKVEWAGMASAGFRLPTEAEWEFACRSKTEVARYGQIDDIAWCGSSSGGETHRVAQKQPNTWGLHDMLGNVWEWVWDWYGDYPGAVTDPVGPPQGFYRVARGGSWGGDAQRARAASRSYDYPGSRGRDLGFRLARPHF